MAKITVSAATVQRRELKGSDPTGETFVLIRPPGMRESQLRSGLLGRQFTYYTAQGQLVTGVDCNAIDLAKHEVWWTYGGTNLEVVIEHEGSEPETVTFKARDDTNYREFMEALDKLGSPELVHVFNEWHGMVLDITPAWRNPF